MIKAIPTKYNGIHFKSKMEAKWAEWLDEKNIIWSYEPEGYNINGTWYLPDFYLPEIDTIIEVKGAMQGISKIYKLMKTLTKKGQSYFPEQNIMILLAGPVPYLYNITEEYSCGFYNIRCSKCGGSSIVTQLGDYSCRSCGYHDGMGDVRKTIQDIKVLAKPRAWLIEEEKEERRRDRADYTV